MMRVDEHDAKFYHISGELGKVETRLGSCYNDAEGAPMIGPMELLLIVIVVIVIWGYARVANRKKK